MLTVLFYVLTLVQVIKSRLWWKIWWLFKKCLLYIYYFLISNVIAKKCVDEHMDKSILLN